MTQVGIREFRDRVSKYVERAEAGEIVTLTRRGKAVARIVPASPPGDMARLAAEGAVEWSGTSPEPPKTVRLRGEGKSAARYVSEGRR